MGGGGGRREWDCWGGCFCIMDKESVASWSVVILEFFLFFFFFWLLGRFQGWLGGGGGFLVSLLAREDIFGVLGEKFQKA